MSFANINGHLSSPIHIFRGLHQDSPLFPILFLLVAQVGSCRLDSRQDISGLRVQGVDIFLSLFADDTDIFTQASIRCIDAIVPGGGGGGGGIGYQVADTGPTILHFRLL